MGLKSSIILFLFFIFFFFNHFSLLQQDLHGGSDDGIISVSQSEACGNSIKAAPSWLFAILQRCFFKNGNRISRCMMGCGAEDTMQTDLK